MSGSTHVWVVGSGGLLGSRVREAAARMNGAAVWNPSTKIPWAAPQAHDVLAAATADFAARVVSTDEWAVLWCAGAGVVGSSQDALAAEAATFSAFLRSLGEHAALASRPGRIFLASSAGGVHGGSTARPVTEETPPAPISAYGHTKLEQERALQEWARERPHVRTLIARISNLYGPWQNLAKPQGLISHMSRSILHRKPVHIYVPLETTRDYLYAEDCGRWIARAMDRLAAGETRNVLRLCASEENTSIATLVSLFRRLTRKQMRVVCSAHAVASQQALHQQFRSVARAEAGAAASTPLMTGLLRVYQRQLAAYTAGALPP